MGSTQRGHILVLTGPPGSGKTTTAATLAATSAVPAVHLHTDDFWHFIKAGAVAPYLPAAHEQNAVVMNVLAGAAQTYAQGGYFVVVDGIIGPWFLDHFRALTPPIDYIVLRPPLADAIARCRMRGGDTLTASGPIAELHRQFSSLGELELHVVDTNGHAPSDTLLAVESALASGHFRLGQR